MYKTIGEAMDFVARLKPLVADASHCELVVAPPFTALAAVAATARGSNLRLSGQDVHWSVGGDRNGPHGDSRDGCGKPREAPFVGARRFRLRERRGVENPLRRKRQAGKYSRPDGPAGN